MKTLLRLQFGDDVPPAQVSNIATHLYATGLYQIVHFCNGDNEEDLIEITLNPNGDLKAQFVELTKLLATQPGWDFVGPTCPNHVTLKKHDKLTRNMLSVKTRQLKENWTCFQQKCRMIVDRDGNNMNYREFMMYAHLYMSSTDSRKVAIDTETHGKQPGISMGYQVHDEIVTTWGEPKLDGSYSLKHLAKDFLGKGPKFDYSKPNHTGQIPPEERNKVTQALIGADYQQLEMATLFYLLGFEDPCINHARDVPNCDPKLMAEHIDQGGVMLFNVDTSPYIIDLTMRHWSQMNHPCKTVQLAVMEVDSENLNGDIFSKDALRKAAKGFAEASIRRQQTAKRMTESDESATKALRKELADVEFVKEFQAKRIKELEKENAELKEKFNNADDELERWGGAKLLPPSFVRSSEKMFQFIAGVNFQDHAVIEQRRLNEIFSEWKKAFKEVHEQFEDDQEYVAWLQEKID